MLRHYFLVELLGRKIKKPRIAGRKWISGKLKQFHLSAVIFLLCRFQIFQIGVITNTEYRVDMFAPHPLPASVLPAGFIVLPGDLL